MIQLRNGVKIPTTLKDCLHLACAECGYKSNAIIVNSVWRQDYCLILRSDKNV